MGKSTQVITDLTTVTTTANAAAAQTRAIAAAGPITSLEGQEALALLKAQELLVILNGLVGSAGTGGLIQSGDANYTELDSVRQVLV